MTTRPRELNRLAEALDACSARLDTAVTTTPTTTPTTSAHTAAHTAADTSEPAPEVERVRRLLRHVADDLGRHAAVTRRLDDEIELLGRRREHVDAAHLAELRRRLEDSRARTQSTVDAATRALVPGGDLMQPSTIMRRLTGDQGPACRGYFGRPPVDRAERVRRLTALLLRGPASHPARVEQRPAVVRVPARSARLLRARHRLLRSVPAEAHLPGHADLHSLGHSGALS